MTKMKESNSQLFKELQQAKADLDTLKTELNHFKQSVPLDYQPGMLSGRLKIKSKLKSYNIRIILNSQKKYLLTDIIREIRDASKVKEDSTISKVKQMIESQEFHRSSEWIQLKVCKA